MKKKTLSRSLSIIVLLCISFTAAFTVIPAVSAASKSLERVRDTYLMLIREKTGLDISYKTLSPSILSGIRMSDITVTDIESADPVLYIRSIKLKWNILKLIGGRLTEAFGELFISGIEADYDDLSQQSVRTRITALFQTFGEKNINDGNLSDTENRGDAGGIADILFSLPLRIRIKNASFSYADSRIADTLHIANLNVTRPEHGASVQLRLSGKNTVRFAGTNFARLGTLALGFSVQTQLTPNVENSFAQLRLSSLRESDYSIPVLNMYASYSAHVMRLSLMQNVLPFTLTVTADTAERQADLKLQVRDLNLFDLFKPKKAGSFINELSHCFVTGDYETLWNWRTRKLAYKADGNVKTELQTGDTASMSFRFSGGEKTVNIDFIDVRSSVLTADYTGSFDIQDLRPHGTARIRSAILPNGNTVSAELYMESFGNESLIFIPQLYFGENSLTALQLRLIGSGLSRDFTFEAFDYSKADVAGPGSLRLNGSFSFAGQKDMQLQISTENLFLDSAASFVLWCLPEDRASDLSRLLPFLRTYIFSFDLFFSTDFKTFTYNSPYAVAANTKKDKELLLLSIDGNESGFRISRFDVISSGQSIQLQANADISPTSREVFFSASLFVNSLPYSFSGIFVPFRFLNITGDYDFSASLYADRQGSFTGSFSVLSLPLAVNNLLFSSSASIHFSRRTTEDWNIQIEQIEIAEVSKNSRISPKMSFSGSIDPGGIYFNKAAYSDALSSLDGNINVLWNFSDGLFDSLTLNVFLSDSFSPERYSAVLQAYNPEQISSGEPDFFEHVYFSGEAEIQSMPSGRFIALQNEDNTLSGKLTALGTLANPSLQLHIEKASFATSNSVVFITGEASLEDKNLIFSGCNIRYSTFTVDSLGGSFSLKDFTGEAKGSVSGRIADDMYFREKTFSSPFTFSLIPLEHSAGLSLKQKSFRAELIFSKLEGSFFKARKNYKAVLTRIPGRFDFTAGSGGEVSVSLSDSGEISLRGGENFPVQFTAFGLIQNKEISLFIDKISAEAKAFTGLLDLPVFSLYSGSASGSGTVTGPLGNPVINAELQGVDITVGVPDYLDEKMVCKDLRVKAVDSVFSASDGRFIGEKSGAEVSLDIDFVLKKLLFESVALNVKTLNGTYAAGKYVMPNGTFSGTAQADLVIQADRELVDVRGLIQAKDLEAVIVLNADESLAENLEQIDTVLDLTIIADTKSRLFIPSKTNPFLRGLVTQTSPLHLQMDTRYGTSSFSGTFSMKGGEILYLNRTFYIREAFAVLNESVESFDPRLTARAEIRERDKTGDPVRIILSVTDQPLSRLAPVFSSVPVKSQQEIMTLLGRIFLGDTGNTNPLALLGGLADYGAQITVFRGLENRLRDLFKFDIFSLRTMFLQNAFVSALNLNTGAKVTAGNFLDNTTVYIGKYFGDTLYADAMLHLTYNENLLKKDGSTGGLVFQPEIGLELPTPFAAIRWSIAPELNSDWKLLVPHTSISLSWKFTF